MNARLAKKIAKVIAIILIASMVITSFSFVFFWAGEGQIVYGASNDSQKLDEDIELLKDTILEVRTYYKDDIPLETLIDGAFQGVFMSLDDPYSVYYRSRNEMDRFIENVSGEFDGIGVSLENYNQKCRITDIFPASPAEKAGIMRGDIIVEVDGIDVSGLMAEAIAQRIRGEKGSQVVLTIEREGKKLSFTLTRETIKAPSVSFEMLDPRIGYIRITSFDSDTHIEVTNAKLQLIKQGADAFIIDLRNNPGGYTAVAASVADQFMPAGPIVHFASKGEIIETVNATGQGDLGIPVVLLVNGQTASAAEILAAAWQDSGTAVLVGTKTYGKGVAQQIYKLDENTSMKLSVFYFLTPNENVIDKQGITPDYIVGDSYNADQGQIYKLYQGFAPMSEKQKPLKGTTGLNVFGAQQRLSLLGYDVEITATMDENTVKAVKSFQKSQGLYPYGVLDYSTMERLDREAILYAMGIDEGRDLQLNKALEIVKQNYLL